MAKQRGRALLIKIGDGGSTEDFKNLCGLTSKTFTINNEIADITTPDCDNPETSPLWRQTLSGIKSISITGDGYFEDSTEEKRAHTIAIANDNAVNLEIVIPNFGTYSGAFRITTLEYGGEQGNGVTYSVSFESDGVITFEEHSTSSASS